MLQKRTTEDDNALERSEHFFQDPFAGFVIFLISYSPNVDKVIPSTLKMQRNKRLTKWNYPALPLWYLIDAASCRDVNYRRKFGHVNYGILAKNDGLCSPITPEFPLTEMRAQCFNKEINEIWRRSGRGKLWPLEASFSSCISKLEKGRSGQDQAAAYSVFCLSCLSVTFAKFSVMLVESHTVLVWQHDESK